MTRNTVFVLALITVTTSACAHLQSKIPGGGSSGSSKSVFGQVPQLYGMTEAEARKALSDANIGTGGKIEIRVDQCGELSLHEGRVCNQIPSGGDTATNNSDVVLIIQGQRPREMPDLFGTKLEEAKKILDAFGVTDVSTANLEKSQEHCMTELVCETEPAKGQPLPKGGHVTLLFLNQ